MLVSRIIQLAQFVDNSRAQIVRNFPIFVIRVAVYSFNRFFFRFFSTNVQRISVFLPFEMVDPTTKPYDGLNRIENRVEARVH